MQRCSVPTCKSSTAEGDRFYPCFGAQDKSVGALFCEKHFNKFQVKPENIAVTPTGSNELALKVMKEPPALKPLANKQKSHGPSARLILPKPPKLLPAAPVQKLICEPELEVTAGSESLPPKSPADKESIADKVNTETVTVKTEPCRTTECERTQKKEANNSFDKLMRDENLKTAVIDEPDISALCRLCAEAKDQVMPIYGESEAKFNLACKISQHLPIKVSRRDKLPLVVCVDCSNTFMAYQRLVENCVKADKKLKRLLKEKQKPQKVARIDNLLACDEDFEDTNDDDQKVELKEESDESEETPEDGNNFPLKDAGMDHEDSSREAKNADSDSTIVFSECPNCKCFIRNIDFTEHNVECEGRSKAKKTRRSAAKSPPKRHNKMKKKDGNAQALMKFLGETLQEPPIIYTEEEMGNTTGQAMLGLPEVVDKSQRFSVTPTGYMCNKCLIKYNEKIKMLRHLRRGCSLKIYQCRECGFRYRSMRDWKRHSIVHKKDRDFKCSECEMCFTSKSSLKHHLISHDQNHRVLCDECGAHFKRVGSLQRHLAYKHGKAADGKSNKAYIVCSLCPAKFLTEARLTIHMNQHLDKSPYVCEKCGHTFASVIGLKIHQTRNACQKGSNGEKIKDSSKNAPKKEVCVLCSKRFQYPHQLHFHHKVSHQNLRGYQCQHCPKSFLWAGSLRKHQKVHSGERLGCDYCSKTFMHRNNLVSHLRIHTGERPYTCSECGKKIMTFYEMKRHKQLQHGHGDSKTKPTKPVTPP